MKLHLPFLVYSTEKQFSMGSHISAYLYRAEALTALSLGRSFKDVCKASSLGRWSISHWNKAKALYESPNQVSQGLMCGFIIVSQQSRKKLLL